MSPILLLVLICAAAIIAEEVQLTPNQMKNLKGTYCGRDLSEALSSICKGIYNTKQKRNMYNRDEVSGHEEYQDMEPIDYSLDEQVFPFPFRSKQRAISIIPSDFRKRSTHGVASECCHKPCSLFEMYGYCGNSH